MIKMQITQDRSMTERKGETASVEKAKLIDKILDEENIERAYRQVYVNKGASGIDGVSVYELKEYLEANWTSIKQAILDRTYRPQPVQRVEIPKPNGGIRKLGIPTVVDRVIEQAIAQQMVPIFEPLFSDASYGFRPGRSCEQAVLRVLDLLNGGYEWIVDIDLEKFFDNVPQDKLMSYLGRVIHDGDTESLIRKFLKAGVMDKGRYEPTETGTPQGGNLSPLLSNVMLNELDKELEYRGLNFVRYADDCVIMVGSEASANRVMHTVTSFIERKLGLKVNASKTQITRPSKLKYLSFGFYKDSKTKKWASRPHEDSVKRLKAKLKKLCCRKWSVDLTYRIQKLNEVIRGWINYFAIANMKSKLEGIDEHLRTMIRVIIWKQWKVPKKRAWGLCKLGVDKDRAMQTAYMGNRYQFVATKTYLVRAVSKEKLIRRGLVSCADYYALRHALKLS